MATQLLPSKPNTSSAEVNNLLARLGLPVLVLSVLILIWFALTTNDGGKAFMRATPIEVAEQFMVMVRDGSLWQHTLTTLIQIGIGLGLGVSIALLLGYMISKLSAVERLLLPYLIGLQAIPMIAIAPILIAYLGPGIFTNGIISALTVFFPMLVTTNVAMRSIKPNLRMLFRSLKASSWQTFRHLELPTMLPILFGGFKVSTSLAVIGSIVGESISAEYGLGYLINQARYVFNQARVLVGLFTLLFMALLLYGLVTLIERRVLHWQQRES